MRLNQILRTNGAFSPKKKGSLLSNSRNIVAERLNLFFYTLYLHSDCPKQIRRENSHFFKLYYFILKLSETIF